MLDYATVVGGDSPAGRSYQSEAHVGVKKALTLGGHSTKSAAERTLKA